MANSCAIEVNMVKLQQHTQRSKEGGTCFAEDLLYENMKQTSFKIANEHKERHEIIVDLYCSTIGIFYMSEGNKSKTTTVYF